jgi:hypothetical protein
MVFCEFEPKKYDGAVVTADSTFNGTLSEFAARVFAVTFFSAFLNAFFAGISTSDCRW